MIRRQNTERIRIRHMVHGSFTISPHGRSPVRSSSSSRQQKDRLYSSRRWALVGKAIDTVLTGTHVNEQNETTDDSFIIKYQVVSVR